MGSWPLSFGSRSGDRTSEGFWQSERGVTLVELLVVLSILGVLMSVVAPSITGVTTEGKAKAWAADRSSIEGAVNAYYADTTRFTNYMTRHKWPTYDPVITGMPTAYGGAGYYIDFANLVINGFMPRPPESAGPANNIHPSQRGSATWTTVSPATPGNGRYNWYIGPEGAVRSFSTSNVNDAFDGTYP